MKIKLIDNSIKSIGKCFENAKLHTWYKCIAEYSVECLLIKNIDESFIIFPDGSYCFCLNNTLFCQNIISLEEVTSLEIKFSVGEPNV